MYENSTALLRLRLSKGEDVRKFDRKFQFIEDKIYFYDKIESNPIQISEEELKGFLEGYSQGWTYIYKSVVVCGMAIALVILAMEEYKLADYVLPVFWILFGSYMIWWTFYRRHLNNAPARALRGRAPVFKHDYYSENGYRGPEPQVAHYTTDKVAKLKPLETAHGQKRLSSGTDTIIRTPEEIRRYKLLSMSWTTPFFAIVIGANCFLVFLSWPIPFRMIWFFIPFFALFCWGLKTAYQKWLAGVDERGTLQDVPDSDLKL